MLIIILCLQVSVFQPAIAQSSALKTQDKKNLVVQKKSKAELASELATYLKFERTLENRYKMAEDYLHRVPSKIDETAPAKKEVAQNTLQYLKDHKKQLLEAGLAGAVKTLETNLTESEMLIALEKFKKEKSFDLAKEKREPFVKIAQLLKEKKMSTHLTLPHKKMQEYYQHYLKELRKKYHIPEGSFVIPKK